MRGRADDLTFRAAASSASTMPLEPFQLVAERHVGDVWRFCASQVGVARADDCCQETMLAALEAYPRLRDPRAVRPWLIRIAARKAIDAHRRSARDPRPQAEVETGAGLPPEPRDDRLRTLVAGLPEKQRLAIVYRFAADLSHREIGVAMDTTEEAARRNVHEALRNLRRRLGT